MLSALLTIYKFTVDVKWLKCLKFLANDVKGNIERFVTTKEFELVETMLNKTKKYFNMNKISYNAFQICHAIDDAHQIFQDAKQIHQAFYNRFMKLLSETFQSIGDPTVLFKFVQEYIFD